MTQVIEIIVSPKGETIVQTRGFTGSSCRNASQLIEEALGKRNGERLTSEFYISQTTDQQTRLRS